MLPFVVLEDQKQQKQSELIAELHWSNLHPAKSKINNQLQGKEKYLTQSNDLNNIKIPCF